MVTDSESILHCHPEKLVLSYSKSVMDVLNVSKWPAITWID